MINKVSEDWGKVETAARLGSTMEPEHLSELMKSVACVKATLKRMCDVSVTRTTLSSAVREALAPILREHRAELFPDLMAEIAGLRERLDGVVAAAPAGAQGLRAGPIERFEGSPLPVEIAARLEDFEARIRRLGGFDAELKAVGGQVEEVQGQVAGFESRLSQVDSGLEVVRDEVRESVQGLEQKLQAHVSDVEGRLVGYESRLEQANANIETLQGEIREGVQGLQGRLQETDERHATDLGTLRVGLEEELRGGLQLVEDRIETARTYFTGLLARLEASVPDTVQKRAGELEAQLRGEIDEMMDGLDEKLADLREMLARLGEMLPRRETIESVDGRLGRLEAKFERVAGQVESIDSFTPELRRLEERFGSLREQLGAVASSISGAVSSGLGSTDRSLGELKDALSSGQSELRSLLDAGIRRWESDQSQTLERLSTIRDTLRDQFTKVTEQVSEQGKSLWTKITRRGEGGLKLSREDWEHMAGKIEGIIAGLESILAKRKA